MLFKVVAGAADSVGEVAERLGGRLGSFLGLRADAVLGDVGEALGLSLERLARLVDQAKKAA